MKLRVGIKVFFASRGCLCYHVEETQDPRSLWWKRASVWKCVFHFCGKFVVIVCDLGASIWCVVVISTSMGGCKDICSRNGF
jgi:hypothetical protein